jgi:hypothetical protein
MLLQPRCDVHRVAKIGDLSACCGVELDPLYVDVIIRRYETATGNFVTLADTGECFEELTDRRYNEEGGRGESS